MGYKTATEWDVTLTVYGSQECPPEEIEEHLKWILEMTDSIEGVAHVDAQPKNPTLMSKRRTIED